MVDGKILESSILFLPCKLYNCRLCLVPCYLEQTVEENKTCSAEELETPKKQVKLHGYVSSRVLMQIFSIPLFPPQNPLFQPISSMFLANQW